MVFRPLEWLVAAAAFAVIGCSTGPKSQQACSSNADCAPAQICAYGATSDEGECKTMQGGDCTFDSECLGDLVCDAYTGVCGTGEGDSPINTTPEGKTVTTVDGVGIKVATTNGDGQAYFTDASGSKFTLRVSSKGNPVGNASVTYFDTFDSFLVDHPDFPPSFFPDNSNSKNDAGSQTISLTPAAVHFGWHSTSTSRNLRDFLQDHGQPKGCVYAEDLTADSKRRIAALGEVSGKFSGGEYGEKVASWGVKVINAITYFRDILAQNGLKTNDCVAYRTFETNEIGEWNVSPSLSLRVTDCLTSIPPENCSDKIDNDCDGDIDKKDSDCKSSTCVPIPQAFDTKCASATELGAYDSCGDFLFIVEDCGPGYECTKKPGSGSYCAQTTTTCPDPQSTCTGSSGCIYEDNFNGGTLNECFWDDGKPSSSTSLNNGKLEFDDGSKSSVVVLNLSENYLTSKCPEGVRIDLTTKLAKKAPYSNFTVSMGGNNGFFVVVDTDGAGIECGSSQTSSAPFGPSVGQNANYYITFEDGFAYVTLAPDLLGSVSCPYTSVAGPIALFGKSATIDKLVLRCQN